MKSILFALIGCGTMICMICYAIKKIKNSTAITQKTDTVYGSKETINTYEEKDTIRNVRLL